MFITHCLNLKFGQFIRALTLCHDDDFFTLSIFYSMSKFSHFIGIDVSLATLDIVDLNTDDYYQINNSSDAIQQWINQLESKNEILCVFEATGCYSNKLAYLLHLAQINCSVVNPAQSDGFTKAQGIVSKNDKQAAHSLALMGQCLNLPIYQQPSDNMQGRKQLIMGINALKKQRQMIRNQLHALNNQIIFAPQVVQSMELTLTTIETQLSSLEEALSDISDEEHQQQYHLITSVVGVGDKTAQLLLCATGGLQHFKSAKQLAKFVGIVPRSHFSGSSVHKRGKITKKGNTQLRATLYMAARSAKRHNQACKDLFERLRANGKPYKQVMVAIMHKLVKQIFGVFHSGISFDNQFFLKFKNI